MLTEFEIDCQTVKRRLDNQDEFLLVDCREDWEWRTARLPGAKLIPMSQLAARVAELESQKRSSIVVYCHHGVRSLNVTHWLRAQGFRNVLSMAGGIDAWSQTVDSTVVRY